MKLAVTGSRGLTADLSNFAALFQNIELIITGGARGIDRCAKEYGDKMGIPVRVIAPEYERLGKVAPLVRDRQIVDEADAVLALWDGSSKGTAYTVAYAKKKGKPVRLFRLKAENM